jgi:hypothetical protein
MMSRPLSSKPINPRSKRWSILGVKSKPFSPFNRSSFDESRQGLQWLAIKCTGFRTPVIRHLDSIWLTRSLKRPCPLRARILAILSVSGRVLSVATSRSNLPSQTSRSSAMVGLAVLAAAARGFLWHPPSPAFCGTVIAALIAELS